ncbi:hypothetical protein, partial [Prevotella histicola]|uniref:hypothetical protein n=1 Tax=Prevotella histicola TaxID=470565 RepID=UPI002880B669
MMEINCHSFLLYPAKVLRKIGIIMEDEEKEDSIPYPARYIPSPWLPKVKSKDFPRKVYIPL